MIKKHKKDKKNKKDTKQRNTSEEEDVSDAMSENRRKSAATAWVT